MTYAENKNQKIFASTDRQGIYEFRVHKDCTQIQIQVGLPKFGEEVFFDTDLHEIKAIREMLDSIIEEKEGLKTSQYDEAKKIVDKIINS